MYVVFSVAFACSLKGGAQQTELHSGLVEFEELWILCSVSHLYARCEKGVFVFLHTCIGFSFSRGRRDV